MNERAVSAAPITRRFVDGPFGQVHIRLAGMDQDGPPLICLHQSPKSSREFIKLMGQLGLTRPVIAVDSPGHGESALPGSEKDATIEAYAASAWAAIDALDLSSPVDLLGHHTGAKVGVEMAWQRPDDVRRLVLVSALILTPEETKAFVDQFQPVPLDEAGTRFSKMWQASIQHRGPGVSLEDLAGSFAENLRAGEAYEWGHHAAFAYNPDFAERVAKLDHPVVILNPKDMLYDYTPRVMDQLRNGTLVDRPDWGFGFMDAYTDQAAAEIERALS